MLPTKLRHGFKYYHREIYFNKPSDFINYCSDTQALISATLAHYFSYLDFTLSIDQRIPIILFWITTCIWQRYSSPSQSSHSASAPPVKSVFISAEISRAKQSTYSETGDCKWTDVFTVTAAEYRSEELHWSDVCEILNKMHQLFGWLFFSYMWSLTVFILLQIIKLKALL